MAPRPFPLRFRVGNDICRVSRIRDIITRKHKSEPSLFLSQFVERILTPAERRYFWGRFGQPEAVHDKVDVVAEFLAGRFAAKEACRKACVHLDSKTSGFQHIMILPIDDVERSEHQSRRPRGLILDKIYEEKQADLTSEEGSVVTKTEPDSVTSQLDGQLCEISISHDGDYATAVAIVPEMEATTANSAVEAEVKQQHRSDSKPSKTKSNPKTAPWDALLAKNAPRYEISQVRLVSHLPTSQTPDIPQQTANTVNAAVNTRIHNLKRRTVLLEKIKALHDKEARTAIRERTVRAELTPQGRQNWDRMMAEAEAATPHIAEKGKSKNAREETPSSGPSDAS